MQSGYMRQLTLYALRYIERHIVTNVPQVFPCEECNRSTIRHKCMIKIDPTAEIREHCERCTKNKKSCTIFAHRLSPGGKDMIDMSYEGLALALLFQIIAAERKAENLTGPKNVADAVRMLRNVHPHQKKQRTRNEIEVDTAPIGVGKWHTYILTWLLC